MDIDEREFEPILDPDEFPEAFGGATDGFFPMECYCLGDGPCEHGPITIQAILERDLEENSNLFATPDNLPGIEEETSERGDSLHSTPAPNISADKQVIESPLTSATVNCDSASQFISDGSEKKESNPEESDSTKAQKGDSANSGGSDSTATEDDSSTATGNYIPGLGRFQIEETSGAGRMCGMYALQISTNKQLAGDTLTPEAFQSILRNEQEMRELNEQQGWRNRNDFHDEQLACALRSWGNLNGYGKLQLGVFAEGQLPYILGANDSVILVDSEAAMEDVLKSGLKTIWIHNDNAMELEGAVINHYSGVTLPDTNEQQNKARREEAANRKERQERQERQAAVATRLEAMRRPPTWAMIVGSERTPIGEV